MLLAQQRHRPMLRTVLERVRALPGVDAAAFVGGGLPLRGDLRTLEFAIPGRLLPPDEDLDFSEVSPDYFRVMRVPLLQGRVFSNADRDGSEPVVILSAAAARRYFPGAAGWMRCLCLTTCSTLTSCALRCRSTRPQ